MILLKDVTHYTVGLEGFDRETIVTDANGMRHRLSRYAAARLASLATGLPIVTHGPNSVRVRSTKTTVVWEHEAVIPALDTPEQIAALIANA